MMVEGLDSTQIFIALFGLLSGLLIAIAGYLLNDKITRLRDVEKRMNGVEFEMKGQEFIIDVIREIIKEKGIKEVNEFMEDDKP